MKKRGGKGETGRQKEGKGRREERKRKGNKVYYNSRWL